MATRKPRILSVQPTSDGGGSETALIGMLGELAQSGWECHLALPPWTSDEQTADPGNPGGGHLPRLHSAYVAAGINVHLVDMKRLTTTAGRSYWLSYGANWGPSVGRLAQLARRLDVDLIHSNSLHCLHGWAAAQLTAKPHLWHAREIVVQSASALKVERFLARHFATAVIAISRPVADQLDPGNVRVIHDRTDSSRYNPDRAGEFRSTEGIPEDTVLIGSAARIDTWKGFSNLIEAWAVVRPGHPSWRLVIAGGLVPGKEDYARALRIRAEEIGGVEWLGSRSDLPEILADLDVFAQTSTLPEPWGLVLVEALASGVPVIAGDQGGPREIAELATPGSVTLVPTDSPRPLAQALLQLGESVTESSRADRKSLWSIQEVDWAQVFTEYLPHRDCAEH